MLFPQIVAAFFEISNANLMKLLGNTPTSKAFTMVGLKRGQNRSYTKYGPNKSDIECLS
jgi:hypothetical protein